MKLAKSILLGSAAGILAVASAQAADLPVRKAAPAEYVRICDAYGAGFFYIPGSDTCLQISGLVRAEYVWRDTKRYGYGFNTTTYLRDGAFTPRGQHDIGIFARGRLNVDARTQTSWGTLRSYFRYELQANTGANLANPVNDGSWTSKDGARLYYGFVQFAGLTAGKAQSFFDFYTNAYNWGAIRNSDNTVNLLAYTATFGGGFSATLSLEDPSSRNFAGAGRVFGVASNAAGMPVYTVVAGGAKVPDVVGALRLDQAWGSVQISGAWGRRPTLTAITGASVNASTVNNWHKDYDVWAVKGGVMLNLPMIASGDQLYLEATYAKGAADFLGGTPGISYSGYQAPYYSAFAYHPAGANNYNIGLVKGWSAMAAFQHYWTPNFRSVLMGSYLAVDYSSSLKSNYAFLQKGNEWRIGGQAIWSPVKNFDIGMELIYTKVSNTVSAGQLANLQALGIKKNPDSLEARIRIQRGF